MHDTSDIEVTPCDVADVRKHHRDLERWQSVGIALCAVKYRWFVIRGRHFMYRGGYLIAVSGHVFFMTLITCIQNLSPWLDTYRNLALPEERTSNSWYTAPIVSHLGKQADINCRRSTWWTTWARFIGHFFAIRHVKRQLNFILK
jgi:hypothetical protein